MASIQAGWRLADMGFDRQDAGTKLERISPCFPSKPT
jgi:hypothetical protein